MSEYKQVILLRKDLKLPKGKACSQVAHAAVEAFHRSNKDIIKHWRSEGMKKVVLEVANLQEMYRYKQQAEDAGLITAVITDAGHTVVEPGTTTCMAIGPEKEETIDRITGKLKIL
jgi:PTH2 family peptidyl-tRNA hydrolase